MNREPSADSVSRPRRTRGSVGHPAWPIDLQIRQVRARGIDLIPERPTETAAGTLTSTPLVLIDILTDDPGYHRPQLPALLHPDRTTAVDATRDQPGQPGPRLPCRPRRRRHRPTQPRAPARGRRTDRPRARRHRRRYGTHSPKPARSHSPCSSAATLDPSLATPACAPWLQPAPPSRRSRPSIAALPQTQTRPRRHRRRPGRHPGGTQRRR